MKIYLDTLPLRTGHQIRGIGRYTEGLLEALRAAQIEVITCADDLLQAEIIHYPYFDLFLPSLPIYWRKKAVVTIHDVIPLEFPKAYKPGLQGNVNFLRQKFSLRFVKAVITDSEYSKQQIAKLLRIKLEKIYVVPLAANPDLKLNNSSSLKDVQHKHRLPEKYILYVGDINYNKNLPALIKAMTHLPSDVELVCVGKNFREKPIPEWQGLVNTIREARLESRVHFIRNLGTKSNADLAAIYHGALCYVQPSLSEGFGLPILEAMQCQTPVVSSRRGSLPEVGGKHAVYVEPKPAAIANGVKEVLSWSAHDRKQWLSSASKWAAGFTWQKTAAGTIDVYKRVLA